MSTTLYYFSYFTDADKSARRLAKRYNITITMYIYNNFWHIVVPNKIFERERAYEYQRQNNSENRRAQYLIDNYLKRQGYTAKSDIEAERNFHWNPDMDEYSRLQKEVSEELSQSSDEFYNSYEEGWFYDDNDY